MNAAWLDGANFVAMIDNLSDLGHEDVVAVREEGLQRFVLGQGVAKVFKVDGRRTGRTGNHGNSDNRRAWAGGLDQRFNYNRGGFG